MTVSFPNESRSFDEKKGCIRFWGYDGPMEISFFVDSEALQMLHPVSTGAEAEFLAAFDTERDRIHTAAAAVYARDKKKRSYVCQLTAEDF